MQLFIAIFIDFILSLIGGFFFPVFRVGGGRGAVRGGLTWRFCGQIIFSTILQYICMYNKFPPPKKKKIGSDFGSNLPRCLGSPVEERSIIRVQDLSALGEGPAPSLFLYFILFSSSLALSSVYLARPPRLAARMYCTYNARQVKYIFLAFFSACFLRRGLCVSYHK